MTTAADDNLRPAVLQLAIAAACRRRKADVPARFADWVGLVELADWFEATGLPEAAALLRLHGHIRDEKIFLDYWPTGAGSFEWRTELDDLVARCLKQAPGAENRDANGAAEYLAENGLIGLDNLRLAGRRENLRTAIDRLATQEAPGFPLPDRGELWDLRALYADPMWNLARPVTRHAAQVICDLIGWDPTPPPRHRATSSSRSASAPARTPPQSLSPARACRPPPRNRRVPPHRPRQALRAPAPLNVGPDHRRCLLRRCQPLCGP